MENTELENLKLLQNILTRKKIKVVTLFLGQMSDPGDLIGLPKFNEQTGLTDFMPPYWFPTDDNPIVLFLDELNRARPEILQVIMDLALNKKLAGKSLPPGSRIISAVNNGDEYELTDLDPALISRFNIYEFCPEVKEWTSWAEKNNIDARIIRYIKSNPKMLDSTNGTTNDYDNLKKSPDRRGWEKVSNIIKSEQNLKEIHFTIISGIVGADAAADFIASQKIAINVSGIRRTSASGKKLRICSSSTAKSALVISIRPSRTGPAAATTTRETLASSVHSTGQQVKSLFSKCENSSSFEEITTPHL